MAISIKDQTVLITGASSGIGEACAHQFAAQGARLIISARRKERLDNLAKQLIDTYGIDVLAVDLDVRDNAQVQACLDSLPSDWQDINILVNNAGLALDTLPLQEGILENWDTMIDTNIRGLLYMTRKILPAMLERNSGHIINIGSISGRDCYPTGNVYCATKYAVKAITKALRLDLLGTPIRVSEVAPGAVNTEFSEVRYNDKQRADSFYEDFTPLLAEDVADTVVYCATRPLHVNVSELVVYPTCQASCNHISRDE